jgi:hypothetical protein
VFLTATWVVAEPCEHPSPDAHSKHGPPDDQQQHQQHPGPSHQHEGQEQRQQWAGRVPAGSSGGRRPPDLAKQLWDWCQLEGGALWNYSQGEIREALAAVGGDVDKLPVELSAVVAKRCVAAPILAGCVGRVSVCGKGRMGTGSTGESNKP